MTPRPHDPEQDRNAYRSDTDVTRPARCAVSPYEQDRNHNWREPGKRRQSRQTVNQAVAGKESQGNRTHRASLRVNKSIAAGERD
jgi:hypothetical protein